MGTQFHPEFKSRPNRPSKIFYEFIKAAVSNNPKEIKDNSKIEVLSIASLMAEAIKRISNSTSVSDLFN